jgi:hypothetical protein
MVFLNIDFEADEILRQAPYDRASAIRVLAIAAAYLKRNDPLPLGFSEHFANALERASTQPDARRAGECLLDALFLKGRRPRLAPGALVIARQFRLLHRAALRYSTSKVPSTQQKIRFAAKKYGFMPEKLGTKAVTEQILARRHSVSKKLIQARRGEHAKALKVIRQIHFED